MAINFALIEKRFRVVEKRHFTQLLLIRKAAKARILFVPNLGGLRRECRAVV